MSKAYKKLWEKGDDGLRYKWNKIGEVKTLAVRCGNCGYEQLFMNL